MACADRSWKFNAPLNDQPRNISGNFSDTTSGDRRGYRHPGKGQRTFMTQTWHNWAPWFCDHFSSGKEQVQALYCHNSWNLLTFVGAQHLTALPISMEFRYRPLYAGRKAIVDFNVSKISLFHLYWVFSISSPLFPYYSPYHSQLFGAISLVSNN